MKAKLVYESLDHSDKDIFYVIDKISILLSNLTIFKKFSYEKSEPKLIIFEKIVKNSKEGFLNTVVDKIINIINQKNLLEDSTKIKNKVLKFLMDYTIIKEQYLNNKGYNIIFFKDSENKNKAEFLIKFTEKLVKSIL